MQEWALMPIRLVLALIFLKNGLGKVFGLLGGPGINGFTDFMSKFGFKPALFWAVLVSYSELICGALFLLGLFSRFAGAVVCIIMVVAILKVHLTSGFEYPLIIMAACIALILLGPGKLSLNKF